MCVSVDEGLQCSDTENLPLMVGYVCDMHSMECGVGAKMGLGLGNVF